MTSRLFKIAASCAIVLALSIPAYAQSVPAVTTNNSAKITSGNTFQQLLAASTTRRSLTIQNNNASDACYLIIGTTQVAPGTTSLSTNITINGNTVTAQQAAIVLAAGIPYQRYFPYIPADIIYVTCATTGDSVYVDTQ